MNKRRRTIEIIESTPQPEKEHGFIKYPRETATEVTDYKRIKDDSTEVDISKKRRLIRSHGIKQYTDIHTHPDISTPSNLDMHYFLSDDSIKTMVIAVRNPVDGKVEGYRFLRKTKKTPKIERGNPRLFPLKWILQGMTFGLVGSKLEKEIRHDVNELYSADDPFNRDYTKLKNKYHLQDRMVTRKGYLNLGNSFYYPKSRSKLSTATASIVGILGGLFLLSPNMTGNAISNITNSTSNILGVVLLFVGLVAGAFWINK